ncbi:hypothetical protein [Stenotrophomonas maltophilia]|uniref:hypothetical protein n=1 Tax=Stenotrophomonas maltophilia TaxID=40324 RepID=UPI002402B8C0|nr:hypothetical protein [Stenotrophomonas maltophilia]
MDAIEKRARELLAAEIEKLEGYKLSAAQIRAGSQLGPILAACHAAIIAALTPPEGYVLVQETQLRHFLSDAITSVEFIAGRGQSKPLARRVRDQAWALVESVPARRKVP